VVLFTKNNGIIAYHSRTLSKFQRNYTTPEKELLGIIDILKTFRTTLLGNKIIVNTDALNLLGKKTLSSRMTGWLLILQEYNIELKHITGESNIFADSLSRIKRLDDCDPYEVNEWIPSTTFFYQFNMENIPSENEDFSLDLNYIQYNQLHNDILAPIINNIKSFPNYTYEPINKFNKKCILRFKEKYAVPSILQTKIINYYHEELCYPGYNRTENSIKINFYWNNIDKDILEIIENCKICAACKLRTGPRYGFLPLKDIKQDIYSWQHVYIDLIGL